MNPLANPDSAAAQRPLSPQGSRHWATAFRIAICHCQYDGLTDQSAAARTRQRRLAFKGTLGFGVVSNRTRNLSRDPAKHSAKTIFLCDRIMVLGRTKRPNVGDHPRSLEY